MRKHPIKPVGPARVEVDVSRAPDHLYRWDEASIAGSIASSRFGSNATMYVIGEQHAFSQGNRARTDGD